MSIKSLQELKKELAKRQSEQREIEKLPKKMKPCQEEWEYLGFSFEDIGDNDYYKVSLPKKWSSEFNLHSRKTFIRDENGCMRAQVSYRKDEMKLMPRYYINCEKTSIIGDVYEIYFGNEEEKLFIAGTVEMKGSGRSKLRQNSHQLEDMLLLAAAAYAESNYPSWRNVHAYWNLEKEDQDLQRAK